MADQTVVKVIHLHGQVRTGESVDRLRSEVEASLKEGNTRIVLNMAEVRSLDSSAIGVMVRSLMLAKQQGGLVKLSAVPNGALQTLTTTGVSRLFEVFEDETKAVESFGA